MPAKKSSKGKLWHRCEGQTQEQGRHRCANLFCSNLKDLAYYPHCNPQPLEIVLTVLQRKVVRVTRRSRSQKTMEQSTSLNDQEEPEPNANDNNIRQALSVANDPSSVYDNPAMVQYTPAGEILAPSLQLSTADNESVCFFFQTAGSPAASKLPFRGYVSEIYNLYQKSSPSSQLSVTTLAVCQLTYSVAINSPRLKLESEAFYGRALYLTRKALESRNAIKSDGMLLTIILLALYERMYPSTHFFSIEVSLNTIDASVNFTSQENNFHQIALPTILSHRGFTQFDQPESRSLFFNLQSQLVRFLFTETLQTWTD